LHGCARQAGQLSRPSPPKITKLEVVNHANKLCRVAPRDQDVIVVDGDVAKRVTGYRLEELTIPDTAVAKTPPRMFRVAGLA
jgi:hypothetical protein